MGWSVSSNKQQSTSQDNRVAGDNGAIGVSGSSGVTINNTTTDGGLLKNAFDYLTAADAAINTRSQGALDTVNQALHTAQDEVTALLGAATSQQQNAATYVGSLAQATPAATAQAGQNNQAVIIAALIGAVALMAKKG